MVRGLAWVCALSAVAGAGNVLESARLVPGDVSVFVAVDDGAELRRSPVGGFALAMIDSVAGFTQTFEAWDRLSADLGWTPTQAFDALLGNRVVFAAMRRREGAGDEPAAKRPQVSSASDGSASLRIGIGGAEVAGGAGGLGPWILMSEITQPTAARISDRLKPMPRQLVAGAAVLSVENGRFLLGLAKRARGGLDADGFTVMIVEAANENLLITSLREARGGGGPAQSLWDSGRVDELRPLAQGADAVVSIDVGAFAGGKHDGVPASKPAWLGAAARRADNGVTLQSVMVTPGSNAAKGGALPSPGWSAEAFGALAKDAVFASVESNSMVAAGPLGRVWDAEFEGFAALIGLSPDLPQRAGLTGRLVSLVRLSDAGEFDAAVAMESDALSGAAAVGDAETARVVASVARTTGAMEADGTRLTDPASFDLGVLPPTVERSLDVSGIAGAGISGMWKGGAKLVWRYVTAPRNDAEGRFGWWVAGLGRSAVQSLAAADLSRKPGEPEVVWNSMISARPRTAVERLEAMGVPLPRPVEALRRIDRFTWFSLGGVRPDVMLGGGRVELAR